jgi:hypothetical protein
LIRSVVPGCRAISVVAVRPTGGGAEFCGPSGCCASKAGAKNIPTASDAPTNFAIGFPTNMRFMTYLSGCSWSDAICRIEDAQNHRAAQARALSVLRWRCLGGSMAKLALIYGMRLLPEDDLGEVRDATVVLKNGRSARVTMHLIEGSKEEIEATFRQSMEAFFEMYPEI